MIEVKNLIKKHNDKIILNDISFNIEESDIVSIIGPSGGGKSSVLRCIKKIDEDFSGIICTNVNYDYEIGMVFQHFNLFSNMTVIENLCFAPTKILKINQELTMDSAHQMLKKFGLYDLQDKYPHQLSGGQKQRVAIMRTMMMNPKIILFDEPTSALDPESVKSVLDIINNLAKEHKITMLIVTHQMRFAEKVSDKMMFLEDGKIIEYKNTSEFFHKNKNKRISDFLNLLNI